MKKLTFVLLAGAAALFTGCIVTSVYPFYHEKQLLFEQALLGNWSDIKDPADQWKFEAEGTNAYRLTCTSGGKTSVMSAHCFKLSGLIFLDLASGEIKDETPAPPIPSHLLLRVIQLTPTFKMVPMKYEWLQELLAKEPKAIRHYILPDEKPEDGRIVLTADTAELQRFVIKYLKTEKAWGDVVELQQEAPAAKAQPAATK